MNPLNKTAQYRINRFFFVPGSGIYLRWNIFMTRVRMWSENCYWILRCTFFFVCSCKQYFMFVSRLDASNGFGSTRNFYIRINYFFGGSLVNKNLSAKEEVNLINSLIFYVTTSFSNSVFNVILKLRKSNWWLNAHWFNSLRNCSKIHILSLIDSTYQALWLVESIICKRIAKIKLNEKLVN